MANGILRRKQDEAEVAIEQYNELCSQGLIVDAANKSKKPKKKVSEPADIFLDYSHGFCPNSTCSFISARVKENGGDDFCIQAFGYEFQLFKVRAGLDTYWVFVDKDRGRRVEGTKSEMIRVLAESSCSARLRPRRADALQNVG